MNDDHTVSPDLIIIILFKRIGLLIQPLLIIHLMDFFEPCSTMSIHYASLLGISTILVVLISAFFHHKVSKNSFVFFFVLCIILSTFGIIY